MIRAKSTKLHSREERADDRAFEETVGRRRRSRSDRICVVAGADCTGRHRCGWKIGKHRQQYLQRRAEQFVQLVVAMIVVFGRMTANITSRGKKTNSSAGEGFCEEDTRVYAGACCNAFYAYH